MAKFFLKVGSVSKKLYLPLIAAILYIIMDIIEFISEIPKLHFTLDLYTRGIS